MVSTSGQTKTSPLKIGIGIGIGDYGGMAVMSIEYDNIENALDEADREAESTTERLSHEEVFTKLRQRVNEREV